MVGIRLMATIMAPGDKSWIRVLRNRMVACINATIRLHFFRGSMRRDVFQAIADPTRRAIIALIALQAMTPNALAEHFHSSRQAVSKHLRILTECRILRQEQVGREIRYHFNPKQMKEVADFIEPFRQMWETKYNQLDRLLGSMKTRKP